MFIGKECLYLKKSILGGVFIGKGCLKEREHGHLRQFLILPEFLNNAPPSKYNIYTHDWKKFDKEKFIFEFNSQNWVNILVLDKENTNEIIDNHLQDLNNLLEKHAPLKNGTSKR